MNEVPHALVRVTGAQPLGEYRLRLLFSDGAVGDVDLAEYLRGPVFEALRDRVAFERVRVDRRRGTIVWPNGADLAPDMLRTTAALVAAPAAATAEALLAGLRTSRASRRSQGCRSDARRA